MKISGIILAVLSVGLIFLSWNLIVDDFEDNYIDTGLSNASPVSDTYRGTYNQRSDINNTIVGPLQTNLNTIQQDSSWWEKLGAGASSIFIGFLALPGQIFGVFSTTIVNMNTILTTVGVPIEITLILGTVLFLTLIFLLVEAVRRYPI